MYCFSLQLYKVNECVKNNFVNPGCLRFNSLHMFQHIQTPCVALPPVAIQLVLCKPTWQMNIVSFHTEWDNVEICILLYRGQRLIHFLGPLCNEHGLLSFEMRPCSNLQLQFGVSIESRSRE